MDRIKLTCLHAVSKTKTSVSAALRTAARYKTSVGAVPCTRVFILVLCHVTRTGAPYHCFSALLCSGFLSHNGTDRCRNRRSADRTDRNRGFTLYHCSRRSVTARVTTAAAVVARQRFTDLRLALVHFHIKLLSGNSKENTNQKAGSTHHQGGC